MKSISLYDNLEMSFNYNQLINIPVTHFYPKADCELRLTKTMFGTSTPDVGHMYQVSIQSI